jgi:hypothetical protein
MGQFPSWNSMKLQPIDPHRLPASLPKSLFPNPQTPRRRATDLSWFFIVFSGCSWLFHSPNKASAAEGFLLGLYRIAFVNQDLPSSPTCLDLPRLAWTCLAQLPIACRPGCAVVVRRLDLLPYFFQDFPSPSVAADLPRLA